MWIDFKLYFYVRIHKPPKKLHLQRHVVNWFQIVFLREDSQAFFLSTYKTSSCELISNCIFTWGFTRKMSITTSSDQLWIDFKLYFYVRIHKILLVSVYNQVVVNWFQIVFLREDSQVHKHCHSNQLRCELISNCIFTWGFTSKLICNIESVLLWIDFKLYFYVRIHKQKGDNAPEFCVVNWFQIVFLREDSQDKRRKRFNFHSCELISNCIFTWGFTSKDFQIIIVI